MKRPLLAAFACVLAMAWRLTPVAAEQPVDPLAPDAPPDAQPDAQPDAPEQPAPAPAPVIQPDLVPPAGPAPDATSEPVPETTLVETDTSPGQAISVSARIGGIVPQIFNQLGSFAIAGVEGGYILPVLEHRLQVGGALLYSRPPGSGSGQDMRLSGDGYDFSLDQTMFIIELGGIYRLAAPDAQLTPFVRGGGRIYLLETSLDGSSAAAASFGQHSESFTELGFALAAGVDYILGPGSLVGELGMGFSNMNRILTGDSNTGALEVAVGYRLFL